MMYMPDYLLVAGIAFYDTMRGHGYTEDTARLQAELYMRRKDPDLTRMDAALALADGLAKRATERLVRAECEIIEPPAVYALLTAVS
jgi:hypothetical protein